jgi:hypothetical protein
MLFTSLKNGYYDDNLFIQIGVSGTGVEAESGAKRWSEGGAWAGAGDGEESR